MKPFSDTAIPFDRLRREPEAQAAASAGLGLLTLMLVVAFMTALACLGQASDPAIAAAL